jgi:hypothetical protein
MLKGSITLASVAEAIPPAPVWTPPTATFVSLEPEELFELLDVVWVGAGAGGAGAGCSVVVVVWSVVVSSPAAA